MHMHEQRARKPQAEIRRGCNCRKKISRTLTVRTHAVTGGQDTTQPVGMRLVKKVNSMFKEFPVQKEECYDVLLLHSGFVGTISLLFLTPL